MPQKGGGLLAKYGLTRNPFTDRTAEKTDLVCFLRFMGCNGARDASGARSLRRALGQPPQLLARSLLMLCS